MGQIPNTPCLCISDFCCQTQQILLFKICTQLVNFIFFCAFLETTILKILILQVDIVDNIISLITYICTLCINLYLKCYPFFNVCHLQIDD